MWRLASNRYIARLLFQITCVLIGFALVVMVVSAARAWVLGVTIPWGQYAMAVVIFLLFPLFPYALYRFFAWMEDDSIRRRDSGEWD